MHHFNQLPLIQTFSEHLSLRIKDELSLLVIDHPLCSAALALQGAHLLHWQPTMQSAVIWLSNKAPLQKGIAIRGGIPICWPWFSLPQPQLLRHGFVRQLLWRLHTYTDDSHGVVCSLVIEEDAQSRAIWPHPFQLVAQFKLGATCELMLQTHALQTTTAALHSYFAVHHINQVEVTQLGNTYMDKIDESQSNSEQGNLFFSKPVDRIYSHTLAQTNLLDHAQQRVIEIHHQYHSDVVTWNPGKNNIPPDMSATDYQNMVCIETARIRSPLNTPTIPDAQLGVKIVARPMSTQP